MLWLVVAVGAHALNALVFVVDKGILGVKDSQIARPVVYAAYSGAVSAAVGLVLVLEFAWPTRELLVWSLGAGALWVTALYWFFVALKNGESSRVVPLTGAAVPLFTFFYAKLFLGEVLSLAQILGVVALVAGGVVLSLKWKQVKALPPVISLAALAAGAAFAGHFTVADVVFERFQTMPFLPVFAYMRLGVGVVALGVIGWLWFDDHDSFGTGKKKKKIRKKAKMGWVILSAFVASKGLGALALGMQNYAIKLGSVTLVNALQGTQYVVLLVLAAVVSVWLPKVFREEMHRVALTQKLFGIVLVSLGLWLIV